MAENAADSLAPAVTADTALPKPRIAEEAETETETASLGSGGPDRRWFTVAPLLLAVVALLAVTLPGITHASHFYDPQYGPHDDHVNRSVYRLFVPNKIDFQLIGWNAFLVMSGAVLVTADATIRPRWLGGFNVVLRLGG